MSQPPAAELGTCEGNTPGTALGQYTQHPDHRPEEVPAFLCTPQPLMLHTHTAGGRYSRSDGQVPHQTSKPAGLQQRAPPCPLNTTSQPNRSSGNFQSHAQLAADTIAARPTAQKRLHTVSTTAGLNTSQHMVVSHVRLQHENLLCHKHLPLSYLRYTCCHEVQLHTSRSHRIKVKCCKTTAYE